jgi:anionic cell wall polymer biosynthesis LytR-Cps2A-Psr (LCP) family protein
LEEVGVRWMKLAVTGKVGFAVQCLVAVVVLMVAGYSSRVVTLTQALGDGVMLGSSSAPAPSTGAMNILVMGLESRTNFQGQTLSVQELTETHSGNEAAVAAGLEGSQDTDTLILIHIFAGGQKAVGFSIPRDDVVNYPHATYDGLTEGKIDAAYAYAYDQSLGQTSGTSMSQNQRYLEANQAGQLFEVQTVESITGVHIDHFIVSDIIGFYELAQQFGGLEVCIQPAPAQDGLAYGANLTDYNPITDPRSQSPGGNSGFDAYHDGYNGKKGGKQYLHLSAAQSLAYVRSRDTLSGVDIGRTARQQAAIDYILWKLKTGGVLSDLGAITTALSNARSYLMYDGGWNLIDFANDMNALNGKNLKLSTLPEVSTNNVDVPGYPSLQSADYVDIPLIQGQVNKAFYGTSAVPASANSVTVDVYNGSGTGGLAGGVSKGLAGMGYKAGVTLDSSSQSQTVQDDSEVFYGSGSATEANAQAIANLMGIQGATSLSSLPAGHVEVLLGSQVTAQAPGLELLGANSVTPGEYVTASQQNNQAVPANVTAAANGGTQSVGALLFGAKPSSANSAAKTSAATSPGAAAAPAAGPPSSSNAQYGLSTCSY